MGHLSILVKEVKFLIGVRSLSNTKWILGIGMLVASLIPSHPLHIYLIKLKKFSPGSLSNEAEKIELLDIQGKIDHFYVILNQ